MEQLLQIHTTWGRISQHSPQGQFNRTGNYGDHQPKLNISKQDGGGLQMEKKPMSIEINMDEVFASVSPTVFNTVLQMPEKARQASLETTGRMAHDGVMYRDPNQNGVISDANAIVMEHANDTWGLGWTPSVQCETTITPEELSFSYTRDEISVDLERARNEFTFQPGRPSTSVEVKGRVDIEYTGSYHASPTGRRIDTRA